jgi:hypothetical protein
VLQAGRDVLLDPAADFLPELLLLRGVMVLEIHPQSPSFVLSPSGVGFLYIFLLSGPVRFYSFRSIPVYPFPSMH